MIQHTEKELESLNLPDPENSNADYYQTNGEIISRTKYLQVENPPTICAKAVQNIETETVVYYILCNNGGQLFDPRETNVRYKSRNVWKFRRVNRTVFDLYIKFLKQKYTSFLMQAQRNI